MEDDEIIDDVQEDNQENSDEGIEGDDLIEGMERDYEARPELDRYENDGLDNEDQNELDFLGRQAVEQQLNYEEHKGNQRRARIPGAFMDDEYDDDQDEVMHNQMRQERMRQMMRDGNEMHHEDSDPERADDMQNLLDFEDVKGPLSVWLKKPDVIKFITRQFNQFLRNFKNETGNFVYEDKIHEMCQNNKQSLEVVFTHLSSKYPTLAIWLAEEPQLMLPILNEVALELVGEVYPDYKIFFPDIYVRVKELPVEDKLRDLRQVHLNALIKIRGVVTKRTGVFPELKHEYYRCAGCNDVKGPFFNDHND